MSTTFRRIPNPSSPANNARKLPDDAYVTTQADNAKGAAAESFALSYVNRLMAEMYRRLTNKEAGNVTPRDYATGGPGHDHDGVNSVFIGTTICAHVRAPYLGHWAHRQAYLDRDGTSAPFRSGGGAFANPDAGNLGNVAITDSYQDLLVWKDLYCGPGVNRLDVSVFAAFVTAEEGGGVGRTIDFRLTTGAGTVDRSVTVPANDIGVSSGVIAYWAHYHLTSSTKIAASSGGLNDLTLRAKVADAAGLDAIAVYGWSITGAHA